MNPLSFITNPVSDVSRAIVMPFKAVFVVGLCWVINAMTSPGVWWVKWVALGMGIATIVAFARAAKSLLVLALVAWVGMKIYRRYGPAARAQFDAWVARSNPNVAQVVEVFRAPAGAAPFDRPAAGANRAH
jgi:hypothetical protein